MIKIETDPYFKFLCSMINDMDFDPSRYQKLLSRLHQEEFIWLIPDDENRALDGLSLRVEFGTTIGKSKLDSKLDSSKYPCTVLEMMIALAKRCETEIMEDMDIGRRVGRWFKVMIRSLGVNYEKDDIFDEKFVDFIISGLITREYEPNGDGGLFFVSNTDVDMRKVEIWYQMHTYLRSIETW